ncbi:MAG: CocE/NonD family hydrolase [Candidatus Omnitrophota bacterium]|nr:CocE/NonD family hydrolase [Candidatus Omnitrophota bacterium]
MLRDSFWVRREVMIPMRDGVRLFTVVMAPQDTAERLPLLLMRTPYGVRGWETGPFPSDLNRAYLRGLAADGYIFVFQSIRGTGRSEGGFVMNRPNRAARDSSGVDESTDAYDTVEWLVHDVRNHNGRVGVWGVSYPGWLAEQALIDPHPAVKAVSPQAPMTDTWMGDDFFHQGAFRLGYALPYAWSMEAKAAGISAWPVPWTGDSYDWYLSFPSLKTLTDSLGAMRIPSWRRFVEHPAYDSVWQRRAFQRLITKLTIPTLTVGGWWDQEDLFGAQATFQALDRLDGHRLNQLVIGPWAHSFWPWPGGDSLGALGLGSATNDTFNNEMQRPLFAYWLKGRGDGRFPKARLFDTGRLQWRSFEQWPPREATRRSLYVHANGQLSFDPPTEREGFDAYISDPQRPVPYRPRPVRFDGSGEWSLWMTRDQRFVHNRPDVLSWATEALGEDVTIAGHISARLFASTTGSDADWVVKLIDVYPDTIANQIAGYQLMVAGDIMRGRYRRSFEHPEAIRPNEVASYTVDLHQQFYTFKRGHRIMVQVQSSWFPLYDRNPQTFVPNIFEAPVSAFRAQTHRIYHRTNQASYVEVMVLPE